MSNDFDNIEPPTVESRVDPPTAKLGDLVTLTIRSTHSQALVMQPAALGKTLGTFEVYASTRLPVQLTSDKAIDQFQVTLQNFATGQQMLPGLEFAFEDPMGKSHAVNTSTLTVTITEVVPGPKDKGDIRGIKGVIGPTAWSPWWWFLLAVAVVGAGVFAWAKRKKMLEGPPPPPPVPADILALDKLRKLSQTDWFATGKTKEFYIAISDIVREYLENGFGVSALERTTGELMRDLRRKSELSNERQTELRDLLENSDLVKFAKFRPEAGEGQEALAAAVKFVEQTRAVIPAKAGNQNNGLGPGFHRGDVKPL